MKRKNKVLRNALTLLLALMTVSLLAVALAADYTFPGAEEPDYYSPTAYEEAYGSAYQYGGMNAVDLIEVTLPFGYSDGTAIGVAERVSPIGMLGSSGVYGAFIGAEFQEPVQQGNGFISDSEIIPPYVYRANAFTSAEGMELPDGSLGMIEIPTLKIKVKVWEGETTESMAKGLGHYSSTSAWDGNVCVCGHNRGAKCAIGPIKDLEIGDTITYTTICGTRTYAVSYVGTISYMDWSNLQPTSDNRITITTCLAGQPEYRICVQAVEVS